MPGYERFIPYTKRINELIDDWNRKYYDEHTVLKYKVGPGFVLIQDQREENSEVELTLTGIDREVFLLCDRICRFKEILGTIKKMHPSVSPSDVEMSIEALKKNKLMISEEEKYLSLPVAARPMMEMTPPIEIVLPNIDGRVALEPDHC